MKRLLIVLTALALAAAQSCAQDEKPPIDIPVYPGGSTTMEVNMTAEELIAAVEAMMPSMAENLGPLAQVVSPADIADVVRDVKRIEYLQVEIPKASVSVRQVADFYANKLPAGQWSRVVWLSDETRVTALFAQAGTEKLYGFRVSNTKQDGKTIRRAQVLKIEGRVDYVKVLKLGAKVGAQLFSG
ncbi:MAG: hypothetical protein QHI38_13605 [Armatimonadota bacterium]|nr:hypothetical protein [Armatimonadota bacterium]